VSQCLFCLLLSPVFQTHYATALSLSVHRRSLYPINVGSAEDEDNEGYEYWYKWAYPRLYANSAFSLYGILKDNEKGERGGSLCHQGTYINSFFTNRGVETIAYPFGVTSDGANVPTSQCSDGNGGYSAGDDDGANERWLAEESYGLGCEDGEFAYGSFNGTACQGGLNYVSDYLEDFNDGMSALECVQVSNASPFALRSLRWWR